VRGVTIEPIGAIETSKPVRVEEEMMRRGTVIAVALAVAGSALPASALVLCQKKSGALFIHAACKKKETQVDPASFGATGPQGPQGPQGLQGLEGPQGPPGISGQAKIDFRAVANTASTTIFDSGKLQITAACDGSGVLSVIATTTVDNATLRDWGGGAVDFNSNDFDIATPITITPAGDEERNFVYTEPGGQVVTIQYMGVNGGPLGGTVACLVTGLAFVQ
jgi:hypothetical protein